MKRFCRVCVAVALPSIVSCGDLSVPAKDSALSHQQPIVGGTAAESCEYPSTVALIRSGSILCTGTLATNNVVVTAAHCLQEIWGQHPTIKAQEISVVVGHAKPLQAPSSERREVVQVIPHSEYNAKTPTDDPDGLTKANDIGVVVLKEPVTTVTPTGILDRGMLADLLVEGADLEIVGYGTYEYSGDPWHPGPDGELHKGVVHYIRSTRFELIAGDVDGTDTCSGDSGGPMFARIDNQYWLVGETSRAPSTATMMCGDRTIYTLLPLYTDWIAQQAGAPLSDAGATNLCVAPEGGTDAESDGGDAGEDAEGGAAGMGGSAGGSSADGSTGGLGGSAVGGGAGGPSGASGNSPDAAAKGGASETDAAASTKEVSQDDSSGGCSCRGVGTSRIASHFTFALLSALAVALSRPRLRREGPCAQRHKPMQGRARRQQE